MSHGHTVQKNNLFQNAKIIETLNIPQLQEGSYRRFSSLQLKILLYWM